MNSAREDRLVWAYGLMGALISVGIVAGCFFLSGGMVKLKSSDRYVTVRGASERIVRADLAVWPIVFKDAGNDLVELQKRSDYKTEQITAYLKSQGFEDDEISNAAIIVNDNAWVQGYDAATMPRYQTQMTVTVRSSKVDDVKKAMQKTNVLVSKGIAITQDWELRPEFMFTALNDIKPEMVAEATKTARTSAEQFAKDSGSRVGNIRRAEQGYFSIDDRDKGSPDWKNVRVVTTVDYYLEN